MGANRRPRRLGDTEWLKIVVRAHGTTTAIELHGECDLAGLRSVRQAISSVLDDVPERVVLDLSQLRFIDSTGLHATIELTERAAAQNTRLVIIPGPEPVQRLFEIAGLLERLPFIDKRPNGSRVARPHTARDGAAGSGAFSPPTGGAGRLHQVAGAAPNGRSPRVSRGKRHSRPAARQ